MGAGGGGFFFGFGFVVGLGEGAPSESEEGGEEAVSMLAPEGSWEARRALAFRTAAVAEGFLTKEGGVAEEEPEVKLS